MDKVNIFEVKEGGVKEHINTMPPVDVLQWLQAFAIERKLDVVAYETDALHPGCADAFLARGGQAVQLSIEPEGFVYAAT